MELADALGAGAAPPDTVTSGTHQYNISPPALVSTVAPPIFAVSTAAADALALEEEEKEEDIDGELLAPPELAGLDDGELPHAAAASAKAARPTGTHHRYAPRFSGR